MFRYDAQDFVNGLQQHCALACQWLAGAVDGVSIAHVSDDSRDIRPQSLFLAYPGECVDGRDYIASAIDAGATMIFVEAGRAVESYSEYCTNANAVVFFAVENLRQCCGVIASAFYQQPTQNLKVVGITGTNGKTSVAYLLSQVLENQGYKTRMIGTLGTGEWQSLTAGINTTPSAIQLQKLFAEYVANNVQCVVMEVSSIAVEQGRVNGIEFDVAVLTNLSRDHLDYHGTMENYAEAKRQFFVGSPWLQQAQSCVVNVDDAFGCRVVSALSELEPERDADGEQTSKVYVVGTSAEAFMTRLSSEQIVQISDVNCTLAGTKLCVTHDASTPTGGKTYAVTTPLIGHFNSENISVVLATSIALSSLMPIDMGQLVAFMPALQAPVGRMEMFAKGCCYAVVDYAHTPEALQQLLHTIKQITQGELVLVFGCGGNRDAGKRALMAAAAEAHADRIFVTSDNPRDEAPQAIIDDILHGFDNPEVSVKVIVDRKTAIAQAAADLPEHAVLVIAGKGHEQYQEIKGVRYDFSDQAELKCLGFMQKQQSSAAFEVCSSITGGAQ